jgi:hypothetical protein
VSVNQADFIAGMRYWATTSWPPDYHNADYNSLAAQNPHGNFTDQWWDATLRRLNQWKATRPVAGATITALFQDHRTALQNAWIASCEPVINSDISAVPWKQIESFAFLASQLKPNAPMPVFTSKFCHFLMPRVFPVVDGKAMGVYWPDYEAHYTFVQLEWNTTAPADQATLRLQMMKEIQTTGQQVSPHFPMETKIVELALIGRFHP